MVVYCVRCGHPNPDDSKYCISCGNEIQNSSQSYQSRPDNGTSAQAQISSASGLLPEKFANEKVLVIMPIVANSDWEPRSVVLTDKHVIQGKPFEKLNVRGVNTVVIETALSLIGATLAGSLGMGIGGAIAKKMMESKFLEKTKGTKKETLLIVQPAFASHSGSPA
ncbi:zinc ribbon domain-containing protein [Sulfuracidifex tepidarius]|uniref:zinc ribbon domain-containing protein n=1 Tax=Sulfuracidifex tepidarius TaxID=1294262 RepID=UPI0006D13AAE|nr:zinc ribbon domain-containing protein [Sulfuracidifex tepidarius]